MRSVLAIFHFTLQSILLVMASVLGIGAGGFLGFGLEAPAPPQVEVRSVQLGSSTAVALTVRGSNAARAELWADNTRIGREVNPAPTTSSGWDLAFRWKPPGAGVYQLAARLFDVSGRYSGETLFSLVVPPSNPILLSSNRGGSYGLYTLTLDGATARPVLTSVVQARHPTPSRGGDLAWASYENGAWHIRVQRRGATNSVDITPDLGSAQHPVWSPEGTRLAFEVTQDGKTAIYIADPDGQNRMLLAQPDSYDGQVTFSPAGDLLAFASHQGDTWEVYVARPDGTQRTRLTMDAAQDWQPAWSPKGDRIAFVSNRSGQFQLYLMSPDGSGVVQLTNFANGVEQPAWSPDGIWLTFVAATGEGEKENAHEVYWMSANGEGLARLTQNAFDDTDPVWMP